MSSGAYNFEFTLKKWHVKWFAYGTLIFMVAYSHYMWPYETSSEKAQKQNSMSSSASLPSAGGIEFRRIESKRGYEKYHLYSQGKRETHDFFYRRLSSGDPYVSEAFFHALRSYPSEAYFFETPPFTRETFGESYFEFVLVDAPALIQVAVDSDSFSQHFDSHKRVVTFPNLGGDATLVVPCPKQGEDINEFAHLGKFMRRATRSHVQSLWNEVGIAVVETAQGLPPDRKKWVSTSGLGVYWLHVRLDDRPKYYQFAEYKKL
jgi:hypothetical protein